MWWLSDLKLDMSNECPFPAYISEPFQSEVCDGLDYRTDHATTFLETYSSEMPQK